MKRFTRILHRSQHFSGQSLVEGLVALSMASIIIVAIIATVTASVATNRVASQKNRASQLVQEGMEIVRSSRGASAGFYCVGEGDSVLSSPVSPATCNNKPNVSGTFSRSVEIIQNSPKCSTGVNEVVVTVSWTDSKCQNGSYCQQSTVSTCLTGGGVIAGNYPYGPTSTPTLTPTPQIVVITPIADAYLDSANTSTNYGSSTTLQSDSGKRIYFKFDLSGSQFQNKTLSNAVLKLTPSDPTTSTQNVWQVDNTSWAENTVTYSSRPGISNAFTSFTNPSGSINVPITSYLTTRLGQVVAFAITGGTDLYTIYSKESGTSSLRPTLTLTLQDASP